MGMLDWLFSKKQGEAPLRGGSGTSEEHNLKRWRDSGAARTWVEAHGGEWGHTDWLALLEELRGSTYWPLDPNAVGETLEDEKRHLHPGE